MCIGTNDRYSILHDFGNPSKDFTKNMGIMHQRAHEKAGYEIRGMSLDHFYALIHPGGYWSFPLDLTDHEMDLAPRRSIIDAVKIIASLHIDVAAVHVHTTVCNYKTLFELLDIPIIGTGGEASAYVADKATSRALMIQAGIKVPRGAILYAEDFKSPLFSVDNILASNDLDFPLVVKPTRCEASVGVHLVRSAEEMKAALEVVFTLSMRSGDEDRSAGQG